MGLSDIVARALVEYRADTSQMRRELKTLQGDEKALAASELEAAEARNKQLSDWSSGLAKTALTLGGVLAAAKVLFDGWKDGIQDARAASAAWYVDIDKLKQASHGLVTENNLVAWSAKLATSAFHNSQADLEDAQRAMRALTLQGRDQAEVNEKITDALQSLRVKGLLDLGIYVDTSKVKFNENGEVVDTYSNKLQLHNRILEALRNKASEAGDGQEALGDSVQQAAVKLQDSWDDLKKGLGQLVSAMQPLLEALATAVGLVAKIAQHTLSDAGGKDLLQGLAFASGGKLSADDIAKMTGYGNGLGVFGDASGLVGAYNYLGGGGAIADIQNVQGSAIVEGMKNLSLDELSKLKAWIDGPAKRRPLTDAEKKALEAAQEAMALAYLHSIGSASYSTSQGLGAVTGGLGAAAGTGDLSQRSLTFGGRELTSYGIGQGSEESVIERLRAQGDAYNEMMANAAKNYDAFMSRRQDTILEKTFGSVGEFELYKKAFDSLTGAVGSAYDAWASGSESASKAFKQFIGQSIMAVGKQMAVEAIKEGAYALGHLAIGDFGGAAAHGAAAAEFAAGAVLAGVVAHELGAGGSSGPTKGGAGAGSGGGGYGSSGGSSAPQQRQTVIVIGEAFAESTPRMRQLQAEQLVKRAGIGNSSVEDS
jgi:hypothetical protein